MVRLRVRSIPKRLHGSLGARHFTQNPLTNAAVVRGVCMLPTAGFQVVMATMGRTLARALNLKRKMTVSGGRRWEDRRRSCRRRRCGHGRGRGGGGGRRRGVGG